MNAPLRAEREEQDSRKHLRTELRERYYKSSYRSYGSKLTANLATGSRVTHFYSRVFHVKINIQDRYNRLPPGNPSNLVSTLISGSQQKLKVIIDERSEGHYGVSSSRTFSPNSPPSRLPEPSSSSKPSSYHRGHH